MKLSESKEQGSVKLLEMVLDGRRITELRQEKGLSQEDLSKRSGISQPQICRLERGQCTNTKLSTLNTVASVLECTPEQLLYLPPDLEAERLNLDFQSYARVFRLMQKDVQRYLRELFRLIILHESRRTSIDKSRSGHYNLKATLADERLSDVEEEAVQTAGDNDASSRPPKKRGQSATA